MPLTLLAFLILISFTVGKNYSFTETRGSKGTSSSKTQAPLAQKSLCLLDNQSLHRIWTTLQSHHSRDPGLFLQNQRSYGFSEETFLEMCGLSEAYQRQRHVLPGMWTTLGRLCRHRVSGSECADAPTCADSDQTYFLSQLHSGRLPMGWVALPQFLQCKPEKKTAKTEIAKHRQGDGKAGWQQRQGKGGQTMSLGMGQEGMAPLPPPPMPPPTGNTDSWMQFCNAISTFCWTSPRSSQTQSFTCRIEAERSHGNTQEERDGAPSRSCSGDEGHEGPRRHAEDPRDARGSGKPWRRTTKARTGLLRPSPKSCLLETIPASLCATMAGVYTEISEPGKEQPGADCQSQGRCQKSTGDFPRATRRGVITIEAEDDPAMQDDVLMNMESSKKIEDGLTHLTTSLGEFAQQADQEHAAAEEQQKKRQRKEESKEAAPAGSKPLASQSMQPFGGAHSG